MFAGIASSALTSREQASVEIRPQLLDLLPVGGVLHPDELVIARIAVVRKVDVVIPEEVVGNQTPRGM